MKNTFVHKWNPNTSRDSYIDSQQNRLQTKFSQKRQSHYILIKGIIFQEGITNATIYALNVGAPNFIKQTLLNIKEWLDFWTIIDYFNKPLCHKHICVNHLFTTVTKGPGQNN